ncbi:MAG: response regulator, partial [Myxococcota bacterium]
MARILVVDDERDIVRVVTKIMSDAGYEVDTARDAEEALERVRVHPPDAVLLDLNLPAMNGREL